MADTRRYVVVTPVRDEALHIGHTIESMLRQTLRPLHWVVVDDGSSDGTGDIVDQRCAGVDWITVVHRPDRGYRAAGGGVMDAFLAGHALVADAGWDYLVKLDGDLSFDAAYFEQCLARFEADPTLGIGGGTVYQIENGQRRVDAVGDPPFHVRGATKIYRRACWLAIGLPAPAPGWDTIDEIKASHKGWTTRTFADLGLTQHKPTGAADGRWSNAFKNGRANYLTGYHPAFMLAKCVRRAWRNPLSVEAIGLLAGFGSAYLGRMPPTVDRETLRYLRRQQVRRLLLRPSIYG